MSEARRASASDLVARVDCGPDVPKPEDFEQVSEMFDFQVDTVFYVILGLTVITSFYGMNFDHLPGLHHPAAAAVVVVGLLTLEMMFLLLFKRMRWL